MLYLSPFHHNKRDPKVQAILATNEFWSQKLYIDYPDWQIPNANVKIESMKYEYIKAWAHQQLTDTDTKPRFVLPDEGKIGVYHNYLAERYEQIDRHKWRLLFVPCDMWGRKHVNKGKPIWYTFERYSSDDDCMSAIANYYVQRVKGAMRPGVANNHGLLLTGRLMMDVWAKNPNVKRLDQLAYIIPNKKKYWNKALPMILYKMLNDDWCFLYADRQTQHSSHIVVGGEVDTFP